MYTIEIGEGISRRLIFQEKQMATVTQGGDNLIEQKL